MAASDGSLTWRELDDFLPLLKCFPENVVDEASFEPSQFLEWIYPVFRWVGVALTKTRELQ